MTKTYYVVYKGPLNDKIHVNPLLVHTRSSYIEMVFQKDTIMIPWHRVIEVTISE